ncbi:MAG: PAS domain S-box protein [Nitrospirae bacterium]|nr:PAS domain S-box protein [Nitrospirota bacterium]
MFKDLSTDSLIRYAIICASIGGIFVLDLITPSGLAISLLYLFPMLLVNWLRGRREPLYFSVMCSVLTVLGFFLSLPEPDPWICLFNRAVGLGLLWAMAVFMTGQRRAVEEKMTAIVSQKSAEAGKTSAVEARAYAEAATLGAVAVRRKAEEEMALSTLRLEGIVQSAMDAIISVDEEQRVVLFNQAAERMFQCSGREAIGQSLDRFIPARFRDAHKTHIHVFGKTGVTNRRMGALNRISALRSDGEEFPVEAAISQAGIDGRKYFTVILRDISESMRLQDQLRQAERLAEMGTLASGMAHEIGTPMNVIQGRAEQLMRRTQEETTKKGLETIVAQVERITKIMNQLLTFARRKPSERRRINLGQTLDDCLEVLQERIRRMRVRVESRYETLLHPVHIHADPDQMSQVFLNLFINAIHAMPDGGTLRISLERVDSHVRAVIADTGHGIPKEDLPKIFHPFFTTKAAGQGTGLGLTVVHGIIQEHGGTITVESEPGTGTTFTVTLPASK